MNRQLVRQMQNYIAEVSIGASALRGQGASGLIRASRGFFKELDLSAIPKERHGFERWLDRKTAALMRRFPPGAQNFGAARKALNLFLRSAAYNIILHDAHRMRRLLPLLELPLDSFAARHLRAQDPSLPRWAGLKSVSKAEHRAFEEAASAVAAGWRLHRVHLDVFFFRTKAGTA